MYPESSDVAYRKRLNTFKLKLYTPTVVCVVILFFIVVCSLWVSVRELVAVGEWAQGAPPPPPLVGTNWETTKQLIPLVGRTMRHVSDACVCCFFNCCWGRNGMGRVRDKQEGEERGREGKVRGACQWRKLIGSNSYSTNLAILVRRVQPQVKCSTQSNTSLGSM